jgi:hypothetical protein
VADQFDPDKYLAEKRGGQLVASNSSGFDPDKYLAEKTGRQSLLDAELPLSLGTPRGYIKGALNALPAAGSIAGGLVGAGGGTLVEPGGGTVAGGVAGAGLGSIAGQNLKTLGEQYLLGEKAPTREEYYSGLAGAGLEGASNQIGGEILGNVVGRAANSKAGKYVIDKAGKGAAKVASALSGVPENEIKTYAQNADEINAMAKASDNDSQEMADQLRQKLNSKIQQKRMGLNEQISKTLEARKGQFVDPTSVLDELEKAKGQLNTKLRGPEIQEIDDLAKKVKELAPEGSLSLKDAHDLKEYLQDLAEGSYQKGGQVFQVGDKTARAAKGAAAKVRLLVNDAAPEVASANNQLAELRGISNVMNKNILAEGKTAASLYAAGSGGNAANAKVLKRLGAATGEDMLGEAEKLAAARTFGKPSLLPVDTTGKSLTRMGVAGVGGYLMGGVPGAVVMEGLASPAALKAGILSGRAAGRAGSGLLSVPAASGLLLRKGLVDDGR